MNERHRPRIFTAPKLWDEESMLAADFASVSEVADRPLDTWQHFVLEKAARIMPRPAGVPRPSRPVWSASEVGVLAGRQNGMTALAESRELGGMYVLGENVVHTTVNREAARNAMNRTARIIKSCPHLDRLVETMYWTRGEEEIRLVHGGSIKFRARGSARSIDSARGADLLVIDDAPEIDDFWWMSAVGARPESWRRTAQQVWYLGTAVDRTRHPRGGVFSQIRHRGLTRTDPYLCWIEYSAPDDRHDDGTLRIDPIARYRINQANPSARARYEVIQHLYHLLDLRTYETEFLGIGDWYTPESA
ncbi:hypothetical protein [Rhodococcus sp. LW-XY12]|uniref:hypothetical protein n=1 Tax=Rhodococcus sp. LW-XY12 TaxID=2856851 RepID=UPI001C5687FD|nr:hypothetical protein [Rhodococcus sp. LW-XY12]QXU53630.1 hypothetical protein KXC42_23380 [Rhodococcus sp. LW-XY12]